MATNNRPSTISLTIQGPIEREHLPALAERVCSLFADNQGALVHCEVSGIRPDAVTVEALARLQLVAQRNQCHVVIRSPTPELRELMTLMGLTDVLPEGP